MSYLRYFCLFAYSGVQHLLGFFLCLRLVSCVPNVASFSGLFMFCFFFVLYTLWYSKETVMFRKRKRTLLELPEKRSCVELKLKELLMSKDLQCKKQYKTKQK
jgi:hypothetical protein